MTDVYGWYRYIPVQDGDDPHDSRYYRVEMHDCETHRIGLVQELRTESFGAVAWPGNHAKHRILSTGTCCATPDEAVDLLLEMIKSHGAVPSSGGRRKTKDQVWAMA